MSHLISGISGDLRSGLQRLEEINCHTKKKNFGPSLQLDSLLWEFCIIFMKRLQLMPVHILFIFRYLGYCSTYSFIFLKLHTFDHCNTDM